ncbi:hypothetical protein [Neisseria shayeganii]|uniref:Secreted protein n=1 Tax=Neisseria shayeganii TaxID=607712 RepID=A0A7D7S8P6_9NEIS|nr:hypothetical protein [Neisseria shayeganii]QMT40911.1 hypothetical protein H3L94_02330 [Neisseria shayeganii]
MSTMLKTVYGLAVALAAAPALAGPAQTYQVKDPYQQQHLEIRGNRFDINTVGANSNLCQIDGRFQRQGNRAVFKDGEGCEVRFRFEHDRVTVDSPTEAAATACRHNYCGHNVIFTGEYSRLPAACTDQGIKNSEQRFQVAYRAGRFAEAARIQQHSLNRCEDFMWFIDRMSARNNLAAAHKNAGDQAACRRALTPFVADPAKGPDIEFNLSTIWREDFDRQLQAAQSHWQQCQP